jgi:serine/threonine-protein kinase RsbW
VSARADRLADFRSRLGRWLQPSCAPDSVVCDIVLAVDEACTNCIDHAYSAADTGIIRIEAELSGGQVGVNVVDFGVWRAPAYSPTRGRGLPIIQALSTRVDVVTSADGTTVYMTFELPRDRNRASDLPRPDNLNN